MKIYQHVDEFSTHDGIGNDILGIEAILKQLNIESFIVCRKSYSDSKNIISHFSELPDTSKDIHILHYGGYGYPIHRFEELKGRKILRFHNFTPFYYFQKFLSTDIANIFIQNELRLEIELYSLLNICDRIWGDSEYNLQTLFSGARKYSVHKKKAITIPIFRKYIVENKIKNEIYYKITFIGRWSCNKKLEDIFYLLYYLKKINPDYKLEIIGKQITILSNYTKYLNALAKNLDIEKNIEFLDNISEEEKNIRLQKSDFLISMSEHEGFGIPLLEAMGNGIPVFAYSQEAVKETLMNSGILFTKKDFSYLAELLDYAIHSNSIKKSLNNSMEKTMSYYNRFDHSTCLQKELASIL
jgi:glycosyltransferase involved in cell wall biosynthesis